MNTPVPSGDCAELIQTIKRKKRLVTILTSIAVVIVITVCSPVYMEVMGEVVVDYQGIHPVAAGCIVLFILLCGLLAYGKAMLPLSSALDEECDPQKHLMLNEALNRQKNLDIIRAVDYFYIGEFESAAAYADKMIADKNVHRKAAGLFNKARCAFFSGNFEVLKQLVSQYEGHVAAMKGSRAKTGELYEKFGRSLKLLVALADDDVEGITAYRDLAVWNDSKATRGYIDYLKGLAAYRLGETQEAVYRFMAVKESCAKTVLAALAEEYLSNLM